MNSKEDQSLIEVWEMKDQVQIDFKHSNYDNYIEFIENDVKEIKKLYKINYRKKKNKQLTTA
jgi:pyruvate-formate lyase-activating enzyme